MEKYTHFTKGSCARQINFYIEDDILQKVEFVGGCSGNTQGIATLLEGMEVNEIIRKFKGIDCDGKGTSCPDQLARGLEVYLQEKTGSCKAI